MYLLQRKMIRYYKMFCCNGIRSVCNNELKINYDILFTQNVCNKAKSKNERWTVCGVKFYHLSLELEGVTFCICHIIIQKLKSTSMLFLTNNKQNLTSYKTIIFWVCKQRLRKIILSTTVRNVPHNEKIWLCG